MLLYRCDLSVYSPLSSPCRCALGLCVRCLCVGRLDSSHVPRARSRSNVVSLYKSREQTDNQMYKPCLVSNSPCHVTVDTRHHHPKPPVTALVPLGARREDAALRHSRDGVNSAACSLCLFLNLFHEAQAQLFDISQHDRSSFTKQKNLLNIRNDCL